MPRRHLDTHPLAIAMWDFSWLFGHYPGGDFECWDTALDQLCERGYNAVRIDAFPHLVAAQADGTVKECWLHEDDCSSRFPWGSDRSLTVNPRRALSEFLPKCQERGVRVGLSTWMTAGTEKANEAVHGPEGMIRVWDETLTFLRERGLLTQVFYVDILNEFPIFNGWTWIRQQLSSVAYPPHPEGLAFSDSQRALYQAALNETLTGLRQRHPDQCWTASYTYWSKFPVDSIDFSNCDILDLHVWMVHNKAFGDDSGYNDHIHSLRSDAELIRRYPAIKRMWRERKGELTEWMDSILGDFAGVSRKLGVPFGNTEGWGLINWLEHHELDWSVIREAGEIGVDLALKHGMSFICTSNFTHPRFSSLWADIEWHRNLTQRITSHRMGVNFADSEADLLLEHSSRE